MEELLGRKKKKTRLKLATRRRDIAWIDGHLRRQTGKGICRGIGELRQPESPWNSANLAAQVELIPTQHHGSAEITISALRPFSWADR
jgi:hypothetical protein